MNAVISFFIRLLEAMFVIGIIGCICSVIPITAYRLFMVLFEPEDSNEAAFLDPTQQNQHSASSPIAQQNERQPLEAVRGFGQTSF